MRIYAYLRESRPRFMCLERQLRRDFMHIHMSLAHFSCLWRGTSIWSQMVLTGASLARRSHLDPKGGGHVLLTGLGAEK